VRLYVFTSQLQDTLDATLLPDAYTARNISITVRTILTGISWLATFVFAANSLGLLGARVCAYVGGGGLTAVIGVGR
jgi:hypothetical protein